jgi:hypothetical protein
MASWPALGSNARAAQTPERGVWRSIASGAPGKSGVNGSGAINGGGKKASAVGINDGDVKTETTSTKSVLYQAAAASEENRRGAKYRRAHHSWQCRKSLTMALRSVISLLQQKIAGATCRQHLCLSAQITLANAWRMPWRVGVKHRRGLDKVIRHNAAAWKMERISISSNKGSHLDITENYLSVKHLP